MIIPKRRVSVPGVTFFVLTIFWGCAPRLIVVDGQQVEEWRYEQGLDDILRRASFETGCDRNDFTTQLLRVDQGHPRQFGVEGCGYRLVYIRPYGGEWSLNSIHYDELLVH